MIHLLGGGSLGLLWAARLLREGHDARLILRNRQAVQAWQTAGSCVELREQVRLSRLPLIAECPDDSTQPIQRLVVCCKAVDSLNAVKTLLPRLSADCQTLLLQNGLGSQQAVSELLAPRLVLWASVTDGAWRDSLNRVIWAGRGQTLIGDPLGGPCPDWLQHLDSCIDWRWEPQIEQQLWLKLAINCAVNPWSALFDCRNGDVARLAGHQWPVLLAELQALLQHQGLQLVEGQLQGMVERVMHATAANSSSMRQDLHAGRRTEIDYILGHACRSAHAAGLATPLLDQLHQQLRHHLQQIGLSDH